jgi:hypothetical protein
MSIATWIGRRLADVVTFLRDKPFVPCQIDWYPHNVEAMFPTDEQRAEVIERIISHQSYIDPNNQLPDEFFDELRDDCGDCSTSCCVATDTLGEFREWNQR